MDPAQQFPEVLEALRRQGGQQPSSAGILGGAQTTNSPQGLIAQQGQAPQQPVSGGAQGPFATSGATKALSNALPGEASMILKSIIKTLDRLTPDPKAQGNPFGG